MIAALLFIIAIVLFVVFAPFGLVAQFVLLFFKDKRERYENPFHFLSGLAFTIDILGNVCCGDLFNMIMLRKGQELYLFGRGGETISSAFGKNVQYNAQVLALKGAIKTQYKYCQRLTILGNIIYNILDAIDENHCVKSIQRLD